MKSKKMSETLVFCSELTRLIGQEDFISWLLVFWGIDCFLSGKHMNAIKTPYEL
jgi:hypothetical protein